MTKSFMTISDLRAALPELTAETLRELGVIAEAGETGVAIEWELPANAAHGDLASPIALQLFKTLSAEQKQRFRSPVGLATELARVLAERLVGGAQSADEQASQSQPLPLVSAVTALAPGFVNLKWSLAGLVQQAALVVSSHQQPQSDQPQTVFVEYVSPNTNKPLHIGHLRNAAIGTVVANLLHADGAQVQRGLVFNDRGLHIMKSCWAYLAAGERSLGWLAAGGVTDGAGVGESLVEQLKQQLPQRRWQQLVERWQASPSEWLQPAELEQARLQKPDHFIGFWYQLADRLAEEPRAAADWAELLQCWEAEDHPQHQPIRQLWQHLNDWFYQGFAQTQERFGFQFDQNAISYESQIYQAGKAIVTQAAEQGILTRLDDGAVVSPLADFNLPYKVLLRRDGTGIYMTFDIELTRQRTTTNMDRLIWVVGADQTLYFQQLFATAQLLGYGRRERYQHLAYGMVRLPEGKMSSRKGRVIYADDLLDMAVAQAKQIMAETNAREHLSAADFDTVAEAVGIGAIKWTMLAVDAVAEITFDLKTSVAFKGFAGPYVQYTHARACSVLRQAEAVQSASASNQLENASAVSIDVLLHTLIELLGPTDQWTLQDDEIAVLLSISTYYEAKKISAKSTSPHTLCTALFELCQRYNAFYAQSPIVSDTTLPAARRELRLLLTRATATLLRDGLTTLGISAVERM